MGGEAADVVGGQKEGKRDEDNWSLELPLYAQYGWQGTGARSYVYT
jgi:hypothetical protein